MTAAQYWQWLPVFLLALMGLLFVLGGVFSNYIARVVAWLERQPVWVIGLFMLGMAAAMALLLLL